MDIGLIEVFVLLVTQLVRLVQILVNQMSVHLVWTLIQIPLIVLYANKDMGYILMLMLMVINLFVFNVMNIALVVMELQLKTVSNVLQIFLIYQIALFVHINTLD